MRARIVGIVGLFGLILALSPYSANLAAAPDQPSVGTPKWVYGHDLKVRKGGSPDFDDKTPKFGVEIFADGPSITISGGSGSGATAVALVENGTITAIKVLNPGTGYTSAPSVVIEDVDGSGATAVATVASEKVDAINVTNGGTKYSSSLLAVSQTGCLAATPFTTMNKSKKSTWAFAHDLRSRAGDEELFSDKTTKYCVEAYKDEATGKILYISEKGSMSFSDAPEKPGKDKEPIWHHALILKTRGPTEDKFSDKTKKFSVEVFKDGNTGNLIYITENGFITVSPAPLEAPAPDKVKAPKPIHGLALSARKPDEKEFGKNKFGVEVFIDENTGGLIYISESGSIAYAPAPKEIQSGKGVTWKHAMVVKARPSNVREFSSEEAKKFGIEVFMDNNTGHLVYIADNGSIAVLPASAAK